MKEKIAILGSTGSIGVNTLDVVARLGRGRFEVAALSADSNIKLLAEQASVFRPKMVAVRDRPLAEKISPLLPRSTKVVYGQDGLLEIVSRSDVGTVVFAISGSSCIAPLVQAIKRKKRIALANKESLVSAGALIMKAAADAGVKIVPIDSEHSAIFQCLEGKERFLRTIYLTGSGGPLLRVPRTRFHALSREFVLNHPRWRMGKKISVDSATMMNKGLEIIEARWLFGVDQRHIRVLIHPEAIIHSMVEFVDGSIIAQMSLPDMRIPIQYALTYPQRVGALDEFVDFPKLGRLSFEEPDGDKFPCLGLARQALKKGGTHTAALNAADEEAVRQYLEGGIGFSRIPIIIEKVMSRHKDRAGSAMTISGILDTESWAKEEVRSLCCH